MTEKTTADVVAFRSGDELRGERMEPASAKAHEEAVALAERWVEALKEDDGDRMGCIALIATGPANSRNDSGPMRISVKTCCRWHAHALLGAIEEAKASILADILATYGEDKP